MAVAFELLRYAGLSSFRGVSVLKIYLDETGDEGGADCFGITPFCPPFSLKIFHQD